MYRVLYVIDSLQTGGAEKSLLDIASRLQHVEPVVCHIYQNAFLKSHFEQCGIRVISLGISGPYNFIQATKALRKVIEQEQPDLVVATLLRSELISRWVCKRLKIPNVGTFVNDTYSPYEMKALSWSMRLKIGFFWILNALSARWCVAFLSNAESIKISNCKALHIEPEKVDVIYRGRRTDLFLFEKHTINPKAPRLLAVGRLLYRKGFHELVLAFQEYLKDYPHATLTIAGEGPYRTELERMISNNGIESHINLLGNSTSIPSLMQAHDIFVFPSHYEGFSGTLVEAMLSGIPIVASDIPMNKEAVEHGVTARLFQVQNVAALTAQLKTATLHEEDSLAMANQARAVAETRFAIDIIAGQHEAFYQKIIDLKKS